MTIARVAIFCALVLPLAAARADITKEIKVEAGKHDRQNVPVSVPIKIEGQPEIAPAVKLKDSSGKELAAQITRASLLSEAEGTQYELNFILPSLKAGESATYQAVISTGSEASPAQSFQWQDTSNDNALLSFGDRPVLQYMYKPLDESSAAAREQTYKVFHHVYNPAGTQILTKGPGGQYTHHRGLFFGFNKVSYDGKNVDIWHAKGAHQQHGDFVYKEVGPVLGRHRVEINWHGKDKEVFAKEQREVTAYALPGGTLINWASRLSTEGGPIKLDGDPQHAGFHYRAAAEVGEKTAGQTIYIRPSGVDKPGATINWGGGSKDERTVNQPWKGMSFVVAGDRYTAAYIDRPENPKEARFSERNYGRFGSYFEYTVTKDQPLELNYWVFIQDGQMAPEQIEALAADFVEPVKASVK